MLIFISSAGALADYEVVRPFHILGYAVVELVAAYAHALGIHYVGERNYRNLRRPASDVHNHARGGLLNRQPHADGGHEGLVFQADGTRAGMYRRLLHRPALDLRYPRRNRNHYARGYEIPLLCRLLYEVAQHYLGNLRNRL